jgi:hypothetical protein
MNSLMTLLKPINTPKMLTPYEQSTSKLSTRKGSSFLSNKQATQTLCSNWPFTLPIPLDKASHAASLFLD